MVATKTKKRGGGSWFSSSPNQTLPENCVVFKDHLENLVKEYEEFKLSINEKDANEDSLSIWLKNNANNKISYYFQMPNNESEDGKYKTFKIIKITKIIKEVVKGNIFTPDILTYKLIGKEYYQTSSDGPKTIIIPGNKNDKMMNAIIKIYKEIPDISKAQTADEVVAVGGHRMRRKHRRKSTKKLAKSRKRKIGTRKSVSK